MGSSASKRTTAPYHGERERVGSSAVRGGDEAVVVTQATANTTEQVQNGGQSATTSQDGDESEETANKALPSASSDDEHKSPATNETSSLEGSGSENEKETAKEMSESGQLQNLLTILTKHFQRTASIQRKDENGSYTIDFLSHISFIQRSYFAFHDFELKSMREGRQRAGQLLVSSGSVSALCDVVVDILSMDTNRVTPRDADLLEQGALVLLNYTDALAEVTYAVREHGRLVPVILETLRAWFKPLNEVVAADSENQSWLNEHMTIDLLGIPHNMALQDKNIPYLREQKTSEVLMLYLQSRAEQLKLIALATLADIVTDKEAERLATSPDLAQFLLTILKQALESAMHNYDGWQVTELVRAVCHLARNDANKLLLVEKGALPLLEDGIKSSFQDEKDGSIGAVWALSLHKENAHSFLQNEMLLDLVVATNKDKTQSETCRRAAEGILWQLRHDLENVAKYRQVAQQFSRKSSGKSKTGHVMISYQWDHQHLVKKIHDLLVQNGFQVWMDIHKMGCSTRQSMAEAVENAFVVLCCMSPKYKDSLPCRQEAEYADDLRKTIIPLKMEHNYKADGWLGLMVAGKIFYDFSGKYPFETKFRELVKTISEAGDVTQRDLVDGAITERPERTEDEMPATARTVHRTVAYAAPSTHHPAICDVEKVKQWSQDDVIKWLKKFGLQGKRLEQLNGEQAAFLHRLRAEAPEYFYNMLKTELQITTLPALLQMTKALDDLPTV